MHVHPSHLQQFCDALMSVCFQNLDEFVRHRIDAKGHPTQQGVPNYVAVKCILHFMQALVFYIMMRPQFFL